MPRARTLELKVPGHAHLFFARWPASDLHIFHMVISRGEYAWMVKALEDAEEAVFLDLGANIGAASRYVLESLPRARVIAVEPDAENIKICRKNLEPYGDRVKLIQAAAWVKNTRLVFEPDTAQTGTEAGVRVREPLPGEETSGSVLALDIPTLLQEAQVTSKSQIAIKIDIEGSEEEIFNSTNLDWLNEVSYIAIELHDKVRANASRNFFRALEGRLLEPPKRISETVFVHLNGGNRGRDLS